MRVCGGYVCGGVVGVIIEENLTWKIHIDAICKLKHFVPAWTYYVFFILKYYLMQINYCILIWGNTIM